jgi:hypothetical protein
MIGITDEQLQPYVPREFVPVGLEYRFTNQQRYVQVEVFSPGTTVSIGDGAKYIYIPPQLDNMKLVFIQGQHVTAGTTSNTTEVQVYNLTKAVDMLSTVLSIDYNELTSVTAGTPVVINDANSLISTNDVLRVDVDAVTTVAPKGLILTLGFRKP